jgi:hypothetical protein
VSTSTRTAPQRKVPPAPAPQHVTLVPAQRPSRRGLLPRAFENTPGRLRLAALVSVLVCLIFALLGANAFRNRGDALDAARAGADQVVRVQGIATNLAQADAVVTNAFLQGGTAGPAALQQFDAFLAAASSGIADASRAEPGDAAALAAVNQSLTRYSAAIATANANNRLGNEVGSAYLRQASTLLRTKSNDYAAMLPTLQSMADTDAQRVDDDFAAASRSLIYIFLAGFVVLAGLFAVQVWLARRTRRMINLPLGAGTVTVFVTLAFGVFAMLASQSAANTVRDTHYTAAKALAQARIAGFDAKANESLTLVYRGTGQDYEKASQAEIQTARDNLAVAANAGVAAAGIPAFRQWTAVHTQIRKLDDGGQWDAAVALATGTRTPTGTDDSPTSFARFDAASGHALTAEANAVRHGLNSAESLLVILGWLTLALGLVAAVLAWRGIAQRLEEYR